LCFMIGVAVRRQRSYLPATSLALQALGSQIAAARRELGWTAAELAGRLGVTPQLVTRIEKGAPGTAIGTVLEAAVVCGVPLFGVDPADRAALGAVAERERNRVALLPARTRRKPVVVDDDF